MIKKELHLHILNTGKIEGPYLLPDEVCQVIHDLSLRAEDYMVTETQITREELNFTSAMNIFLHKKKKKKADIETEAMSEKNLVFVTGEVKQ